MSKESAMNEALPAIDDQTTAFSHTPEHGFGLFLSKRTKTIHFIRHAEGKHNEANRAYGNDTPVTYSTPGSWKYLDAKLTYAGIQQCVDARKTLLADVKPQLVVVSPFTRTLQTAHVMFGGSGIPFIVHDLARERSGKFTCDKRRTRDDIVAEIAPLYKYTSDSIDFDSFGYHNFEDNVWTETREADELVTGRAIALMQWLASRPETEVAVVTHSSWLKHLFRAFGENVVTTDKKALHRLAGNAEVRSVCLALHRGFYPEGRWEADEFIPHDHSFRRYRWAPTHERIAKMHNMVSAGQVSKPALESEESMAEVVERAEEVKL